MYIQFLYKIQKRRLVKVHMRLRHIKGSEEFIENSKDCMSLDEAKAYKGRVVSKFATEAPIYIEVGTGKGQFIRNMALLHKDINFIGIERYESVLMKAVQRKEALEQEAGSLDNLKFMCGDALLLGEVFEKGEVDRIYLNFSDPWPKKKHTMRRLTSPIFLRIYENILKQDGVLEFKTDNRDLFEYSLESIPSAGWEILYQSFDFHSEPEAEGNIMTEYEEKFSGRGQKICKLIARQK